MPCECEWLDSTSWTPYRRQVAPVPGERSKFPHKCWLPLVFGGRGFHELHGRASKMPQTPGSVFLTPGLCPVVTNLKAGAGVSRVRTLSHGKDCPSRQSLQRISIFRRTIKG